jgi:hypothetical protein
VIAKSITIKGRGGKSGRCVAKAVELTFYEQEIVKGLHKLTVSLEFIAQVPFLASPHGSAVTWVKILI